MASLSVVVRRKRFPPVGAASARAVLGDVRLEVEPGESVAITGPSGCGKTTLLNLIAGLDTEFEGEIVRAPGSRLGYVFQEPRLLPWRTVAENLALVLPEGMAAWTRIERVLTEVELTGSADVYASRLSLGMARRVAIARAFVVEPSLLLLDEPFVSLDEPTAQRLRLLLLALLDRYPATAMIFVTHHLSEAIMLARRLIVLDGSPARISADLQVPLGPDERRDAEAVEAFRRRQLPATTMLRTPAAMTRPELPA
jgi:NitT/TauT family transport system ATP-binding protein